MEYVYDYHKTLDELQAASNELLSKPHGVFFNTQIRKTLAAKFLFLISSHALEVQGEEYAVQLRKQLNCSHCARFFARMGSVVFLDSMGSHSVYWNPDVVSDPVMKKVVADMKRFVEEARVSSVFNMNSSYAHYTEQTNNGGKEFRHFYVESSLMTPHSPLTLKKLNMPDPGKLHAQVEALIRFAVNTPFAAVAIMEQWFQSGVLKHVASSEENLHLTKGFLATIATLKASPSYEVLGNPYARETAIVNMVWRYALADQNLLTLKNSLLGKTIAKVVELEKAGNSKTNVEAVQGFWKTQSSGLKHRRTSTPASTKQIGGTLMFLEENGYMASLEQVETPEAALPVVWESKSKYTEVVKPADATTQASFADFAKVKAKVDGKDTPNGPLRVPGTTDVGYFFNEVMPHVESMALIIPVNTRMRPAFWNSMANPEAKKIFTWDTIENPCPHIMFSYESVFSVTTMVTDKTERQGNDLVINIPAVTTPETIGLDKSNSSPSVIFLLDDLVAPGAPRPTLFASCLLNELYDHRRALEDYSAATAIPRCDGQQAVGFPIGAFDPHAQRNGQLATIELRVKYTREHAVLMGREFAIYAISLHGYLVQPEVSKFPRIVDRYVKVDEEDLVEDPAAAEVPLKTQVVTGTVSAS